MAIENEELIDLAEAGKLLKRLPRQVQKLIVHGFYGVRLEGVFIQRWATSREACGRFLRTVGKERFAAAAPGDRSELLADLQRLGVTLTEKLARKLSTRAMKAIRWNVMTNGGETSFTDENAKRNRKAAAK